MTLPVAPPFWRARSAHRRWLADEANSLLAFYEPELIDRQGRLRKSRRARPAAGERPGAAAARDDAMVHGFAIAHLLGRPGAADIVDHGVRRSASATAILDTAAISGRSTTTARASATSSPMATPSSCWRRRAPNASATPTPTRCSPTSREILETRFWDKAHGASAEEFREDWTSFSDYRGQNANMHLTEALMAAFEATGDASFLAKAESVADLILRRSASAFDWRVPEHYRADWTVDRDYKGSDMFRPYGVTPGHSLEWTRLALQLWALGGRRLAWLPDAARGLFARATRRRVGQDAGRRLLHARMERRAARSGPAVVAGVRGNRRGDVPRGARRRRGRRGVVPAPVGLRRAPFHRPARRRLAAATRRFAQADRRLFRRQARPLSRAAGVPDPALSNRRVADARDFGEMKGAA